MITLVGEERVTGVRHTLLKRAGPIVPKFLILRPILSTDAMV